MPVLNVGDFQMIVQTVQETQPSLKIMGADGVIYYANAFIGECPNALKVSNGEDVYTIGSRSLYYEVTTFDTCETVTLVPGCYTVEIMGGRGGQGGNNADEASGLAQAETLSFSISVDTTVYLFRGGDGKNGGVNSSGSIYSGGGGGASGVPSFFQVGIDYIVSQGGDGAQGAGGYNSSGVEQTCGAGGGGSATSGGDGWVARGSDALGANGFVCGGGGGGAVGGAAGATSSGFLYNGSAGAAATDTAGGAGGNSSMGGLLGSSSATGGAGGANVAYTCGTQTIYSYGGGGGGSVSTGGLFGSGVGVNGGAGGSGSTGSSSVSYVRIYRFG
ncbi:MAG: hypothetical protein IKB49_04170 [Alphaproteobacteria bacterium]|nr:hypothetical protein [Alphaproteobacteria bacterium]